MNTDTSFSFDEFNNQVYSAANPISGGAFSLISYPLPSADAIDMASVVYDDSSSYIFLQKGKRIFVSELGDDDVELISRKRIVASAKQMLGQGYDSLIAAIEEKTEPLSGASIPLSAEVSAIGGQKLMDLLGRLKAQGINPAVELASLYSKMKKLAQSTAAQEAAPDFKEMDAGSNTDGYLAKSEAKIGKINSEMAAKWKNIRFDKGNTIEEALARAMHYGNDTILLGETGVGKTYAPNEIAKRNNLSFHLVQFQTETDSVDLHGANVMTTSFASKEPSMRYRYGMLAKAFIAAREDAKKGRASILVLDELLRAADSSPLISSLSVFDDTREFCLTLPNENEFILVQTENAGKIWMKIDHHIDRDRQGYEIAGGKLYIAESMEGYLCTDEGLTEIMSARGDLMTITEEDARKIAKNIQKTKFASDTIRVPSSAISIVATSNIGMNYDVSMKMDNALFRRMKPIPVERQSVPFMVDRVLARHNPSGSEIDPSVANTIRSITVEFLESVDDAIATRQIDTIHRVNFSTADDIIRAVDKEDPLGSDGFGNIFSVLEDKATHFMNIDSSFTASELLADRSVTNIRTIVKNIADKYSAKLPLGFSMKNTEADAPAFAGLKV